MKENWEKQCEEKSRGYNGQKVHETNYKDGHLSDAIY